MDKEIVKAFLWERIIKLAFSPLTTNERHTWLQCYLTTIPNFWGIQEYPIRKGQKIIVNNKHLELTYECLIENNKKGTIEILVQSSSEFNLMWTHAMDGECFHFPNERLLPLKPELFTNLK